jgi:hypothetical protein
MVNFHIIDAQGRRLDALDKRPLLLMGTYNKMLEYTRGIYQELRLEFYLSLRRGKELVICGYGFGDEGINSELLEWMYSSPEHRLIIIHPKPEELIEKARTPTGWQWKNWVAKKKLEIIQNGIEKTSWCDIRKHFCSD